MMTTSFYSQRTFYNSLRTSIFPVTAAEITAVRYSFNLSISNKLFPIVLSNRLVFFSIN